MFFKGKASQLMGTASGFLEVILSADALFTFADYINTAIGLPQLYRRMELSVTCVYISRVAYYGIATQFTAQPIGLLNQSFTSYKELIISLSICQQRRKPYIYVVGIVRLYSLISIVTSLIQTLV